MNVLVFHRVSADVSLRGECLVRELFVLSHIYPFEPSACRLALFRSRFLDRMSDRDIFFSG